MSDYFIIMLYIFALIYFIFNFFSVRKKENSKYKSLEIKYIIVCIILLIISLISKIERLEII